MTTKGKKQATKKPDAKWESSTLETYEKDCVKAFLREMQLPTFDESFDSAKLS